MEVEASPQHSVGPGGEWDGGGLAKPSAMQRDKRLNEFKRRNMVVIN